MAGLISNSTIMTNEALNALADQIPQYKKLRKDVEQAIDAGLPIEMTTKQIDEKIAALAKMINAYSTTRFVP
jgi:prefoldin subunit 5